MFVSIHPRLGWAALAVASSLVLPATAQALPDLKVVNEFVLPPSAAPSGDVVFSPNTQVNVRTRITNESRETVNLSLRKPSGAAQHSIAWYYVESGKPPRFVFARSMLGEMRPFTNKFVNADFRLPSNAAPGNQRICAVVDPMKAIPESNESNNRACTTIKVVRKGGTVARAPALKPGTARKPLKPGVKPLKPGTLQRVCINPAIVDFQVGIIRRKPSNRFEGTINLKVVLKNIGTADYVTNANQQSVQIFNGRRLIKNQAFGNLRKGETKIIAVQIPWNAAGEFQENLKAMIVYDPDIRMDGNPKNDDCNMRDNSRSIAPARVNRLFTG